MIPNMSKVKLLKEMAEDAENARVNAIIELATEDSGEFNKKLFAELLVREFCEECQMISEVLDQRKEHYWREWMYEDGFRSVIRLCTGNVMKRFGLRRERGSKGKKKYK